MGRYPNVVYRGDLEREEVFEALDRLAPGTTFTYCDLRQAAADAGRPICCLGSMLQAALREAVAAGLTERAGRDWTRAGGPNLYRKGLVREVVPAGGVRGSKCEITAIGREALRMGAEGQL